MSLIAVVQVDSRAVEKLKLTEVKRRFQVLTGFVDGILQSVFDSTEDSPRYVLVCCATMTTTTTQQQHEQRHEFTDTGISSLRWLFNKLYEMVTKHFPAQGSLAVGTPATCWGGLKRF